MRSIAFIGPLIKESWPDIPRCAFQKLQKIGVHTSFQLCDLVQNCWKEEQARSIFDCSLAEARLLVHAKVERRLPPQVKACLTSAPFTVPPMGFAGVRHDCARLSCYKERNKAHREQTGLLVRKRLKDMSLPSRIDLTRFLRQSPVRSQGHLGSCTGWGSTVARDFLGRQSLSPLFAYMMAKALDGRPDVEGSWQYFALRGMCEWGHLLETALPYTDSPKSLDVTPYLDDTDAFLARDFVDLLLDSADFTIMADLIRSVLAGVIAPGIGPHVVPISLALYESFFSATTTRFGIATVPVDGEKLVGGHAMCAVGYIAASDADNPLNQGYVLVRNSWGTDWAWDNVLGPDYRGHVLIPEQYFSRTHLLHEAFMLLAEPSPAGRQSSLMDFLVSAWSTDPVMPPIAVGSI